MSHLWIYIFLMIAVTNLIRIIPPLLIHGQIRNKFLRSFLYYVPYVTLAVMTFPAITEATSSPLAGALALVLGIIAAWFGLGLFPVSIICCVVVLIAEYFTI
ncbi:MAG: AzlD domain-containing protein [Prevotellaceae bacterium]|nr:AzlD domain-containing protein [Prevotellaceae bacterium]